jgi:fluoroacetyl-CoA thioesterase
VAVLSPGRRRTEKFTVLPEHLASEWGNNLPVLATPIVLWWTEVVAMHLMEECLGEDMVTVGAGHDKVRHLAPTPIGQRVRVTAEVSEVSGNRAVFEVEALDETGPIYEAVHSRAVASRERFLQRLERRLS